MGNDSYDGVRVVEKAKTYSGKFKYVYGARSSSEIDCSGFVLKVLNELHSSIPLKIGNSTNAMITYAKANGGIRKSNPQVGDLALWEGHVEFVSSTSGLAFSTFGASSNKKNNGITPSEKAFTSVNDPKLAYYGSTKIFLGFFTPSA